jgi:hypothetical protein
VIIVGSSNITAASSGSAYRDAQQELLLSRNKQTNSVVVAFGRFARSGNAELDLLAGGNLSETSMRP